MAARDDLEGEIDGKMVALFNRLKQLEDANLMLEQVTHVSEGEVAHVSEARRARRSWGGGSLTGRGWREQRAAGAQWQWS
eukprot:784163-Prymnesium_polylepis.1